MTGYGVYDKVFYVFVPKRVVQCCTHLSVGMMLRLQYDQHKEPNDRYKDHLDGQLTTKIAPSGEQIAPICLHDLYLSPPLTVSILISIVWQYKKN